MANRRFARGAALTAQISVVGALRIRRRATHRRAREHGKPNSSVGVPAWPGATSAKEIRSAPSRRRRKSPFDPAKSGGRIPAPQPLQGSRGRDHHCQRASGRAPARGHRGKSALSMTDRPRLGNPLQLSPSPRANREVVPRETEPQAMLQSLTTAIHPLIRISCSIRESMALHRNKWGF